VGEGSLLALGETDRTGEYRLDTLPPGRYFIRSGLIGSPTYYPGVSSRNTARSVNVVRSATSTGIDFSTARPFGVTVRGRLIFDPQQVSKRFTRLVGMGNRQVSVGEDGVFEFTRVLAGTHLIVLTRGGPERTSINVTGKDVEVELRAPLMAEVDGRLVAEDGQPERPIPVTISGSAFVWGSVSTDGGFQAFLPTGTYRIETGTPPEKYVVKSVISGSTDLMKGPLSVIGGQSYSIVINVGRNSN
jgi:hypothetical protein